MIPIVLRVRNESGFSEFRVASDGNDTVLDLVESLRASGNKVPPYRHSCHHGSCGTCGAIVNGKEALMCLVRVAELPGAAEDGSPLIVTIEPLRGMALIAGIAVHPSRLFTNIPPNADYLFNPDSRDRVRFEACIECGICVSACPVTAPFLGPAALAAVNRERQKHPESSEAMLSIAGKPDGAAACARHFACSRACPQAVYPAKHIQLLKNALAERGSQ